ncbi:MAG: YncE family protein [Terriglobia bacterium]|jgi:outer membrane protein assembly factor BamB
MNKKVLASAATMAILLVCTLTVAGLPEGGYHLLKKIRLAAAAGGREYFDYITFDPDTRRIYLSHGTEVKVVDADSWRVLGSITGLKRCHGVALAKEFGKGFITDGDSGTVQMFDLKTLKVTGEVKADADADSIIYDPASKHIFSFNGDSRDSTVIDPQSGTVIRTLPLPGAPEFPVADGQGTVYVNSEDQNEVMVIDSRTLAVRARWPVAPAGAPTAMAMDREHRRLFIGGRNPQVLVVMNADNGKVIQSFPITAGVDANIYEPATGLVFSSTREGIIHVFQEETPDKFIEVVTIKTEYGAKTMALDPKTHHLFVDTADFGQPPAPTPQRPHPNPVPIPGTFRLLVYGR